MYGNSNCSEEDEEDCDEDRVEDHREDVYEDAEGGNREEDEDDSHTGTLGLCVSVGNSGNLGGPVNLCSPSPSPSISRPFCPYSPLSLLLLTLLLVLLQISGFLFTLPCLLLPLLLVLLLLWFLLLALVVVLLIALLRAVVEVRVGAGAMKGIVPMEEVGSWER